MVQQQPVRRSDQFQAAGSHEGTIVVVGNQGLVLGSPDKGLNWQRTALPGWPSFIAVTACLSGLFVALATEGQVWVSTDDGISWLANAIDTEEAVQAITCDLKNNLWVVGSFSSFFKAMTPE